MMLYQAADHGDDEGLTDTRHGRAVAAGISDKEMEESFPRYEPYLFRVVAGEADDEEEEMLKSLLIIKGELEKWGIPMVVDPVPLGLAALWDREPDPPKLS